MDIKILLVCIVALVICSCDARKARPPKPSKEPDNPKAGCSLVFKNFPDKEPVFFDTNFNLIEPKEASIDLKANEEVIVTCPGNKNILVPAEKSAQKAKCVKNDVLKWDKEHSLEELVCNKAVVGDLIETDESCANNQGVLKRIGHKVDGGPFVELFNVCYDMNNGGALYSDHIIYGSAIANAKTGGTRPGFKKPGLAPGVDADKAYKQAEQKKQFASILGSENLANDYINTKSFLARGHLTPDGDMVYVTSSSATYFYVNTVPQWQAVNNGNWKSLEFAVRNTAANLQRNLRVLTGGFEVLTLNDSKGKPKPIYLANESNLPVPKFSWKIVQDVSNKKTIAFVTVNNPFLEEVTLSDLLCKDICASTGWGQASWNSNFSKGLTYCCDVKELRNIIKFIPDLKPKGILEANNAVEYRFLMD